MKFTTAAIFTALATAVSANFTIYEPWSETVWKAGGVGTISWASSADDASKKCEIHLLSGNGTDAIFVSNLTANGNLVPCNYTQANVSPLPDYASGDYFVRLGPTDVNTDYYAYSGIFKFVGNGTVAPEN
ncbi:MAG: hypothetical protein EXX96DRAFT_587261 [Benjaminiella poitrasii]|nr:MAG: hypothetical protein EXX96DRAFT_587261 [Benjaminiella poitrasii]